MHDRDWIMGVLPHRPPFLLLDRVTELEPGVAATAEYLVRPDDSVLAGHFPGHPVFPGVLIIEALAQTGAVAILSAENFRGKLAFFGGIDRCRFRQQVRPGDRLRLEVRLDRVRGPAGRGTGRALVDDRLVAEAEMLFVLGDRSQS
ncbi:MAG: 3-hydroxyacyl-ACP dehydratase FabZ [Bacillota bacterium]